MCADTYMYALKNNLKSDLQFLCRNKLTFAAFFTTVYVQPWTRFGPYAIGIALGMIMYRTKCRVRLSKVCRHTLMSIISFVIENLSIH